MSLLKEKKFTCRVSSVLNKNVKEFGKQYMFDESNETCWNSDSGTPQWILVNFEEPVDLSEIEIEFQGGFAGKKCSIESGEDSKDLSIINDFFPEDTNTRQRFPLTKSTRSKVFKIIFHSSTDFFGRIVVYKLLFHS
ncbi:nuclear receptor 2C2-associated protein [Leptopilina heterotoma]|uniref:nuclear receptor 2C2-associated protein n=1 Tax=Leptopilina heterotoma TaxID=63436 RepID=UPI001CA9B0FF|nr:nuclear receptor 2C2-associated protein [Leptopilina heterotoma]